ncbi:MAG: sulfatase-like hydrolase/transferase, partial [Pseudohongiellaceae bacterium]
MEWLFFVTKPSILSYYSWGEKLSAIFLGSLVVWAFLLPAILLLLGLGLLLGRLTARDFSWLTLAVPALMLASTVFLLVDNFTYTVLGFYAGSFTGVLRYSYGVVFVLLAGYMGIRLRRTAAQRGSGAGFSRYLAALTLLPAAGFAMVKLVSSPVAVSLGEQTQADILPNIVILSSDGINAANMSAYGYARRTTPFIDSLLDDSLLFRHHFTNAANTTGSVISLLTGKLPTTTGVVYPPDTLRGEDAWQHLPGILKRQGYSNADISIRFYADSEDLNLQQGFDFVNGRELADTGFSGRVFGRVQRVFPSESLFLRQSYERISSRLFYISGLRDMENPYELVTVP